MAGGFSIWGPVFGKAMSDAALGYTQGMLDLPKEQDAREEFAQKKALRPLKLQQEQLELDELKARLNKPYVTPHGIYQKNPMGVYEFTPTPGPTKALHGQARLEQAMINRTNGTADLDDLTIIEMERQKRLTYDPWNQTIVSKPEGTSRPVVGAGGAPVVPSAVPGMPSPSPRPGAPGMPSPSPQAGPPRRPVTMAWRSPVMAIREAAQRVSEEQGVPVGDLLGLAEAESNFDPQAKGPVTRYGWQAEGLGQLSPDTGKRFGVSDFTDPYQNLTGTAKAWKEALAKAGGDPRGAYQRYYNPHASEGDTARAVQAISRWRGSPAAAPVPAAAPGTPRTRQEMAQEAEQDRRRSLDRQDSVEARKARAEAYGPMTEERSNAMITLKNQGLVRDVPFAEMSLPEQATVVQEQQRTKTEAARQAAAEQHRKQVAATYGPMTIKRSEAMVLLTAQQQLPPGVSFDELDPAQMAAVVREEMRPEREKQALLEQHRLTHERMEEERTRLSALQKAQPAMNELRAIDTTKKLTDMILPLLSTTSVGTLGWLVEQGQGLLYAIPGVPNPYHQRAEAMIAQNKPLVRAIDEAAVQTRMAANVQGSDPSVQGLFSPNPSRLRTLVAVLTYVHALTIKRSGGTAGRGVTVQDLKRADDIFPVHGWLSSTPNMIASLQGLQGYIQGAREEVNRTITDFGFDPVTHAWRPQASPPAPGPVQDRKSVV